MVLLGPDDQRQKLDDRPFAARLCRTGEAIAAAVGWEVTDYTEELLEPTAAG